MFRWKEFVCSKMKKVAEQNLLNVSSSEDPLCQEMFSIFYKIPKINKSSLYASSKQLICNMQSGFAATVCYVSLTSQFNKRRNGVEEGFWKTNWFGRITFMDDRHKHLLWQILEAKKGKTQDWVAKISSKNKF